MIPVYGFSRFVIVSVALTTLTRDISKPSSSFLELMSSSGPTSVINNSGNSFKAKEAPKRTVSGPLSEPSRSKTILYCSINKVPLCATIIA